jgi:hypothetical protein
MTADEYEAAVALIAQAVKPHTGALSTEECRREQCQIVIRAIHEGRVGLGDAVAAAMGGDPYMDRAVRHVAREYLASRHIPEELGAFLDYVLRSSGPAQFPKGQHKLNFWSRNATIRMLVEETKQHWKIEATRNEATEAPAAATIVSEGLRRCGIKIGEKQVGEIFRRQGRVATK